MKIILKHALFLIAFKLNLIYIKKFLKFNCWRKMDTIHYFCSVVGKVFAFEEKDDNYSYFNNLINEDVIFLILNHLSFFDLNNSALVSKQWRKLVIDQKDQLQFKIRKAFVCNLRENFKPRFLGTTESVKKFVCHRKVLFFERTFGINGKIYKKTNGPLLLNNRNFIVIRGENNELILRINNKRIEQQILFQLNMSFITLSTKHYVQSEFAIWPVKWVFYPSYTTLSEDEVDFFKKIKLDIEEFNKKLCFLFE